MLEDVAEDDAIDRVRGKPKNVELLIFELAADHFVQVEQRFLGRGLAELESPILDGRKLLLAILARVSRRAADFDDAFAR